MTIDLKLLKKLEPKPGNWPAEVTYIFNPDILDRADLLVDCELSSHGGTYSYSDALNQTTPDARLMKFFAPKVKEVLIQNELQVIATKDVIDCLTYSFLKSFLESRNG